MLKKGLLVFISALLLTACREKDPPKLQFDPEPFHQMRESLKDSLEEDMDITSFLHPEFQLVYTDYKRNELVWEEDPGVAGSLIDRKNSK